VPDQTDRPFVNELEDMISLYRSPLHSYYRTGLSEAYVSPTVPLYRRLGAFLSSKVWKWLGSYLQNVFRSKHGFQDYTNSPSDQGIYRLPSADSEAVRIGLVGDWGTGTPEAHAVTQHVSSFDPHFTIHLADIYYVGDELAVKENFLGVDDPETPYQPVAWRLGSLGSFALNGNHEMYAKGHAYFKEVLPRLGVRRPGENSLSGQKASFFCLENANWRIVALDTGYNSTSFFFPSCRLEDALMKWLYDIVKLGDPGDSHGIVILTHHQYFSAFEDKYDRPAKQLAGVVNRPVLWFWGHEHRLALYGKCKVGKGIEAFGRCVGHGGMPIALKKPADDKIEKYRLAAYDNRPYMKIGDSLVGFNGFANLTFKGPRLQVDYFSLKKEIVDNNENLQKEQVLEEKWEVRDGQLRGAGIRLLNMDLSVTSLGLGAAQQ